jgi:hypothetical protein
VGEAVPVDDPNARAEMHPRPVFRIALPIAAVGWLALPGQAGWSLYLVPMGLLGGTLAAWRDYIRIEDGVVYERRAFRWRKPMLLSEVVAVSLHYEMFGRELPHRELRLWSTHRLLAISLWWWSHHRPFLEAVRSYLSEPGPPGQGRSWKVEAGVKTRRRLEYI